MNLIEALKKSDSMRIKHGDHIYLLENGVSLSYDLLISEDWEPVMKEPVLLPCPFCGEKEELQILESYVACDTCHANGPMRGHKQVQNWNTRHRPWNGGPSSVVEDSEGNIKMFRPGTIPEDTECMDFQEKSDVMLDNILPKEPVSFKTDATYNYDIICSNCGIKSQQKIPKETKIRDYERETRCFYCGCWYKEGW